MNHITALEIIENFCEEYNFNHKVFTPYQIRMFGDTRTLDIYPVNQKYHNITMNERGKFDNLFKFLDQFFRKNSFNQGT